jgi:hypothetical protein
VVADYADAVVHRGFSSSDVTTTGSLTATGKFPVSKGWNINTRHHCYSLLHSPAPTSCGSQNLTAFHQGQISFTSTILHKLSLVLLAQATALCAVPHNGVLDTGLSVRDTSLSFNRGPWTNYTLGGLSNDIQGPTPDSLNPQVATAAIAGLGAITAAVCTSGTKEGCTQIGFWAAIGICFVAWLSRRDIEGHGHHSIEFFPQFAPTEGCDSLCALRANVPKNGTLTHV